MPLQCPGLTAEVPAGGLSMEDSVLVPPGALGDYEWEHGWIWALRAAAAGVHARRAGRVLVEQCRCGVQVCSVVR